jgi:hypothetical protein
MTAHPAVTRRRILGDGAHEQLRRSLIRLRINLLMHFEADSAWWRMNKTLGISVLDTTQFLKRLAVRVRFSAVAVLWHCATAEYIASFDSCYGVY